MSRNNTIEPVVNPAVGARLSPAADLITLTRGYHSTGLAGSVVQDLLVLPHEVLTIAHSGLQDSPSDRQQRFRAVRLLSLHEPDDYLTPC